MKKLFLIISFILAAIGMSLGEPPIYSFENNLSNTGGWPFSKKQRNIDLKVESSVISASITPVAGIATNSFIALTNNNIVRAFGYNSGTITPVAGVATNSYIALMSNNIENAISNYTAAPTFSNLSVSTLSVGSTSTLTGIVTTSSLSSGSSLYLNASSGQDVFLQTNGSNRFRVNSSYGAVSVPFRIGSTTAPSASLDITGTMSVSGTASVNSTFNIFPSVTSGVTGLNIDASISAGTGTLMSIKNSGGNTAFVIANSDLKAQFYGGSTVSTPVISFVGGTTSGLGYGGNRLGLIANGNTGLVMNTDGKIHLGAGSTSLAPTAQLEVNGTTSVSGTSTLTGIQNNGSYTSSGNITTTGSGSLTISPNYARLGNLYLATTNTSSLTTSSTSGTIAVLSDIAVPINVGQSTANPSDGASYFFGNVNVSSAWAGSQAGAIYIPYNCTLIGYTANFHVGGTLASSETSTLNIDISGSLTQLSSSITMTATANTFTASGLSTNINAGQYIQARLNCPTWVTNPTSLTVGITFWVVRRP